MPSITFPLVFILSTVTPGMHCSILRPSGKAYGLYKLSVGFYLVQIGPLVHEIQHFLKVKFAYNNL